MFRNDNILGARTRWGSLQRSSIPPCYI